MGILTGQVLTEADLAGLYGNAWANYTPALTGVTLGTGGSNTGSWHYVGLDHIAGYIQITLGTGGLFTGTPTFGFPTSVTGVPDISATARDDSTTARRAMAGVLISSSTMSLLDSSTGSFVTATVPWTWAVNDTLVIAFNARKM